MIFRVYRFGSNFAVGSFARSCLLGMSPKMGPKAKAKALVKKKPAAAKPITGLAAKVGHNIEPQAITSLAKLKSGTYERKDMQNAMNHMNTVAKQGRPKS